MKGKLSISRPNDEFIRLELKDANSSEIVTRIEIDMKEFAMCLTGLSYQECNYKILGNLNILGKTKEIKQEKIDISNIDTLNFREQMLDLINSLQLEKDGWNIDEYCIKSMNHHNLNKGKYTVTFYRYV